MFWAHGWTRIYRADGIIQWSGGKICVYLCHLWDTKIIIRGEGYYRPPLSPPKNPIKREKKKLVYSSEREDFIKSGEDWFVRFLRVGMSYVFRGLPHLP